jgi:GNAT superfamily N-acetyltransferase
MLIEKITMTNDSIYPLTHKHIDDAIAVYSTAFFNDPLFVRMFPKKSTRKNSLKTFFRATVKYAIGRDECYGISSPIEGVAIWEPPGKRPISIWAFLTSGYLKLLFTSLVFSAIKFIGIFFETNRMHNKYGPPKHNYYLSLLAVHPDSQGEGLAGKLLRPVLKKADKMHVGTYLETTNPQNVPVYEHFGFQVMEKLPIEHRLGFWAMYRPKQ